MPLEVRSLSDRIYEILRVRIVTHEIPPGEAIRQDTVAAEFGVSKVPLREALARLEEGNLVQLVMNKGFISCPLSMAEAEEIFYLRMILEPSIAATTAIQASPEDHQHVNSLLKALEQSGADMRIGMEVRRNLMLSMLKQPNRPTTTKLVSQLFDRSERYHYGEVTEGFLDIPGLKEVIRSWLSVDIEALKHHYARRIAGRLECARVALS